RPYSLGDPDYIKRLAQGHVEIIEALLAHDEERVCEAMGAHIRMSRVRLEAYLNTHTSERLQLRP
ncbi:MAG: FCD domain-containing protein, partial [Pyramidobacter sp.]|nr:FCD domain-containing protein [Pyramidobacter sp.]